MASVELSLIPPDTHVQLIVITVVGCVLHTNGTDIHLPQPVRSYHVNILPTDIHCTSFISLLFLDLLHIAVS